MPDFITSRPRNDLMGVLEMVVCMQLQVKEIEGTCEHRLNGQLQRHQRKESV